MRILKRNLALMLALVMALGLMTTASAANVKDYKDANDVTYVEAVDVLTALKVLDGTDGSFNPTAILTREQGAKIIAYLMLGADAAKALSTSVAPFKDVAANRWSAGYVAYCVSQNIIGGYGDGNFGPEDTLTANQFAKMLLCAVGYNVNGEFTGSNWEIEVSKTALTEGVFDGNLGANFSAGVKREEAALYAFNTLTSVMTVSYSDVFGTYYSGKLFNNEEKFNNEYTLGYKLYNLESKDSTDEFDRECHYWVKKSTKLTGDYHDAADATYTAKVKSGTLYTDLGLTKTVNATVIRNGIDDGTFQIKKGLTSTTKGGNGVVVEAYVDEDENVTLIIIDTYLAQVTDVADGEVEVSLVYDDNKATTPDLTDETFETAAEYAEDDYVLVTIAAGEIQSMTAAKTETGKISIYADSYVTLDSTKYNKTYVLQENDTNANDDFYAVNYDSEMKVILDQYGYVIAVLIEEEAETTLNYALVTKSQYKAGDLSNSSSALIEVTYLDGKSEVLPLRTKKADSKVYIMVDSDWRELGVVGTTTEITYTVKGTSGDTVNALSNEFYSYTLNSDGQASLKTLKSDKAVSEIDTNIVGNGGTTLTDALTSYRLNSTTVLKLVGDDKVSTYTGYKNITSKVLNFSGSDVADVLAVVSGSIIKELYVVSDKNTESGIIAFYNGTKVNVSDGTRYTLFVNGEEVQYLGASTAFAEKEGIYEIQLSDGEIISDTQLAAGAKADKQKITSLNTERMIVENQADPAAETTLYFNDEVKVYDITDGGAEASLSRSNWVVYMTEDVDPETKGDAGANADFVTYVYIVSAPDNTTTDTPTTSKYTVAFTGKTGSNVDIAVSNLVKDQVVKIDVLGYGTNNQYTNLETLTKTIGEGETSASWTDYAPGFAGTVVFNVYVGNTLVSTQSFLFV